MDIQTTARNATPQDLMEVLLRQQQVKVDAVVPAQAITARNDGLLEVAGVGPDGPAGSPAILRPTELMDADLATSLGIPVKYVRVLRQHRPHLLAANYNEWLHGGVYGMGEDGTLQTTDPDGRSFLMRTFVSLDGTPGIARSLQSPRYRRIDNLDVVSALMEAVAEAGITVDPISSDLSETRMSIKLLAPEIQVVASRLLAGYRNPFGEDAAGLAGRYRGEGGVGSIVSAGVVVTNSETGRGAVSVKPWAQVLACLNGMKVTTDMFRAVHLGSSLDQGILVSAESDKLNLSLIKSQMSDAIRTYLDYDFLANAIDALEEKAVERLADPAKAVELVGSALSLSEQEIARTLSLFVKGGQDTAGGIMQAVSALAQTVDDPDRANEIEGLAIPALNAAYALR